MSNKEDPSTEEVRFRHLAWISKKIANAFQAECRERNYEPGQLLRILLEERYEPED